MFGISPESTAYHAAVSPTPLPPATIERQIDKHFSELGLHKKSAKISKAFRKQGYVELKDAIPSTLQQKLASSLEAELQANGKKRNAQNPTSKTPRKFTSISNDALVESVPELGAIYNSPAIRKLQQAIVQERVEPLPSEYKADRFVAHLLDAKGSVHGYHIDPFPLAMLLVVRAAPRNAGGYLKFIAPPPHEQPVHPDSMLRLEHEYPHLTRERRPSTGSIYFLAAQKHPHMVTELERDLAPGEGRINVTMSYLMPDSEHRTPEQVKIHFDKELRPAFPEDFEEAPGA